jgi:hypothetical protein
MLLGIDHLVIVVNDLESAAQDYQQLGFTVVPGGRHPVGSHNVLIPFADGSYLEIIAFYREATDHRWWDPLETGERLVDYCFRTDGLRGDTQKFREAGIDINDPVPWSRTRPDGYELKWLLSLARGRHRGVAPFLIEDVTPRSERVPQTFKHQNGASGIKKLTIAVANTTEIGRAYDNVLGRAGEAVEDTSLRAAGLRFTIGPHALEFLSPPVPESPLYQWIEQYGPSPYSAEIRSSSPATGELDPALTHGANLYLKRT